MRWLSLFALLLLFNTGVQAQYKDSLKTGFLVDAAEEYWPAHPGLLFTLTFITTKISGYMYRSNLVFYPEEMGD